MPPSNERQLAIPRLSPAVKAMAAALAVVLAVALGSAVATASAGAAAAPIDDAEADLIAATRMVADAEAKVLQLQLVRQAVGYERGQLRAAHQEELVELEEARWNARNLAVDAYMRGAPTAPALTITADLGEVAYRTGLLETRANDVTQVAEQVEILENSASERVVGLSRRVDGVEAELEQAKQALGQSLAARDAAQARIDKIEAEAAAEAAAAARARTAAVTAASSAAPQAPAPVGSLAEGWAKLRACESGGRYDAVSRSGAYRGAYQFDQRTWNGVGGSGDPAAASPAEQDKRAQILYDQRGNSPWPHCGRYLP